LGVVIMKGPSGIKHHACTQANNKKDGKEPYSRYAPKICISHGGHFTANEFKSYIENL